MRPLAALCVSLMAAGLGGCFGDGETPLQGYVAGTYVYVSAETAGRIVERPVMAGQAVDAGAVLARLEDADQVEALAGAEARLAQARAEYANLLSGERPEELSVIAAQLSEAEAAFTAADDDYRRQVALHDKGVVAQAAVDNRKAERDAAEAKVAAVERQLEVAQLPARAEQIDAAKRNVAAQQASVAQAKIALEKRVLTAPDNGLVAETFFEPGELAGSGQAVVSLLPDANKKIRFFLPEPQLAAIDVGQKVEIACDNCAPDLVAEVTFIATDAEFTPPVIYSRDNREKLVFRIEARPLGETTRLKVGQPVDVTLTSGGTAS